MIRIGIADDHAIVREALVRMLPQEADIEVVASASKGSEVLPLLAEHTCDVLVVDIDLPEVSGIELLPLIKEQHPNVAVVIFSMYSEAQYGKRMLLSGASAYIHKSRSTGELLEAIRAAAQGRPYVTDQLAVALLSGSRSSSEWELTAREAEVVRRLVAGQKPSEIAHALRVQRSTVSTHLANARAKLGARTNSELALVAASSGELVGK